MEEDCLKGDNIVAQAVTSDLRRSLEVLAHLLKTTQNMLQTTIQMSTQERKKSSKLFNKFPLKYQTMLLVVSRNIEDTPDPPNKRDMDFFQNPSSINEHIV